jgi:hypothetical protein
METTYSVLWQEGEQEPVAGTIAALPLGLRFSTGDGREEEIGYEEITALRVAADDLDGKPSLLVERHAGPPLRIASVARAELFAEIAQALEDVELTGEHEAVRLLAIVPLKEDRVEAVRALLRRGPPVVPRLFGIDRYEAYLAGDEAIFVFEAVPDSELADLLSSMALWDAAPGWRDNVAGLPRVVEAVYAWEEHAVDSTA